ncbi:DNA methyltransferase [Bradyrhizobium genomosp. I (2014)]|uniref:DNA methyltransferase n=1 Tax=Bradyrhizobium genomosp. I (2014) TaxID=2683269 RepID=UPI0004BCB67F|nr:DNA methyltransferase [Bradyrhizobium sp. CCBAU 43298]
MGVGLKIGSPKRNKRLQTGWEGFFPYYAGFPELFVRDILESAELRDDAVILDPWNGSGTTTYAASQLGLKSIGIDLNPVMIIVARARLLPPSEADHLRPLAATILAHLRESPVTLTDEDPLLAWFQPAAARVVRSIEQNIRRTLLGSMTKSPDGIHLDRISGTAATLYVALFAACRRLAISLRSSNPTWIKLPKADDDRLDPTAYAIAHQFAKNVRGMSKALAAKQLEEEINGAEFTAGASTIQLSDTATMAIPENSIDFVLTSPPYCTRIDYTAATRVELAVLGPLLKMKPRDLGRRMIGSVQVPEEAIKMDKSWGPTCSSFLAALKKHPSKASDGYYYKTHLDYFNKTARSLIRVTEALKPGGRAIFVVQDSYYKELHNDLPAILTEMGARQGLSLSGREDFHLRSMSDINPGRKTYERPTGATEAVLCFVKTNKAARTTPRSKKGVRRVRSRRR